MRIAVFDPYLDTLGGGEKYMLSAASFLSKQHKVSLLWDNKEILKYASERFNLDFDCVKVEKNIFASQVSFQERFYASLTYDRIFYLSDGSIPLIAPKRLLIHFQFPVEWVNGNAILTQFKINTAKKIICNSQFTKKYIDQKFHIQSEILYPPSHVDTTLSAEKQNIILTVGRLSRSKTGILFKKQDVMISAFTSMIDKGLKGWKFILVISYKKEDKSFVQELKESAKKYPIEVIENCSGKELDTWYSRAKIYWHAAGFNENLQNHPEKAEHFGIATVEAMAKGAVPIVINSGGQREIVENGQNGFLWDSLEEMKEKTLKVVNNKNLINSLATRAQKDSQKFSEEKFREHLQTLII